jgi:hypothetical protein
MKIVLVTCIYQRPELTKIILSYYRNFNLKLLAAGSEGEQSKQLAESCGWDYIETPNAPLTYKHTALFQAARERNPDAVLLIGSDDLLSTNLINYYQKNYSAEADYLLGLKDLYFYSAKTKKAIHHLGFIGNKIDFTIGCGRIFSRKLLDKIDWKPWGDEKTNRGLDIICSRRLAFQGIKERQITMQESGIAVDIKTNVGLTKMETFNFNFKPIYPIIFDFDFAEEMQKINLLSL